MFGTSWRVGRIAGIEVRVDSSWVVIALLITYSMYLRFSFLYKGLSTGAAVGIAVLAAVLFFGRPGGCWWPKMARWWGSSPPRISPGGCAVGGRSTADRPTAERA